MAGLFTENNFESISLNDKFWTYNKQYWFFSWNCKLMIIIYRSKCGLSAVNLEVFTQNKIHTAMSECEGLCFQNTCFQNVNESDWMNWELN